ncbi:hypothetical protein HF086_003851 [Spodoptera exigua]|uniref:DDE Tnp4 domain-containing protein n=1 Tax=Spodoptera exigua TaxID=7107 RepID=A0A922MKG3_SPOEX|nr:hypothetical protein HF086_003851 [Spodoptera exigua]
MPYLVEIANVLQFSEEDKICRPCLQRAQRYASGQVNSDNPTAGPSDQPTQEDPAEEPAEDPAEEHTVPDRDREVQVDMMRMIPLPGYTRAPFNSHVCIIAACNNRDLKRIHFDIRATVLQEKCFYIPRDTRVSEEHMLDTVWQNIESSTRRILNEFTPSHLKDMMDMLRTRKRKSYSLHKFRRLLKPFLMVCSDGHIIDIYGLYEATKSDATILSEIMKNPSDPFHWFFHENDVLILDRGFRDCIEDVETCG